MNAPADLAGHRSDAVASLGRGGEAVMIASSPAGASSHGADTCPANDFINGVGHLTRLLHDTLYELGYDRQLQSAAAAIPDARQRLNYVATLTEQAASRTLNAIEAARPLQDQMANQAVALAARWDTLMRGRSDEEEFGMLASATHDFLRHIPEGTRATSAHLHEIMMAQDFQDLTGQVIKKITELAQHLESQLLKLLLDHAPEDKRTAASGLLNGPLIDGAARDDVVTEQAQVDDLLESLGF